MQAASRADVKEALRTGSAVVVNALSREAYRAAHIPGSISLPKAEVAQHAAEVLTDRRKPVIVYCAKPT